MRRWRGGVGGVAVAVVVGTVGCSSEEETVDAPVEEFMHVHGLELPEWSPEAVYLATHQGVLDLDADEGWRMVSGEQHDFMGFVAHPSDEDVFYSSGHPAPGSDLEDPLGFMVSTDGGRSWEERSLHGEVDFHALTVGAGGEVLYGWDATGGEFYRSTDEGHDWDVVETPELQRAGGALTLAAHPADPQEVWAGTEAELLHSDDGGRSWDSMRTEPVTALRFDPADGDRVLAYAAPPGPGLLESEDGGQSWSELDWRLETDVVGHLAIHPENPDLVYAGTHGEDLYRSDDAGQTWQQLAQAGTREEP